jgi:hypothetical protein
VEEYPKIGLPRKDVGGEVSAVEHMYKAFGSEWNTSFPSRFYSSIMSKAIRSVIW